MRREEKGAGGGWQYLDGHLLAPGCHRRARRVVHARILPLNRVPHPLPLLVYREFSLRGVGSSRLVTTLITSLSHCRALYLNRCNSIHSLVGFRSAFGVCLLFQLASVPLPLLRAPLVITSCMRLASKQV
jgi:hypothetical protein